MTFQGLFLLNIGKYQGENVRFTKKAHNKELITLNLGQFFSVMGTC